MCLCAPMCQCAKYLSSSGYMWVHVFHVYVMFVLCTVCIYIYQVSVSCPVMPVVCVQLQCVCHWNSCHSAQLYHWWIGDIYVVKLLRDNYDVLVSTVVRLWECCDLRLLSRDWSCVANPPPSRIRCRRHAPKVSWPFGCSRWLHA